MIALPLVASAVLLQVVASGLDHTTLGCAMVDRFVRLEARAPSSGLVGSARIYFRAPGHGEWYWVSMSAEADVLRGVLPRPTRKLTAFEYYIEVVDVHMQATRTPDFTVRVEPACEDLGSLPAVAPAPVVVNRGSAGLPMLPPGFSSTTTGDGGSPAAGGVATPRVHGGGATTALVVGGVVAAGLAVAAIAHGSGGASSTPTAACPPPAGSGPAQSQSFAWSLPGGSTSVTQRFELPFPVTGAGVVEARTSHSADSRVCTCLGTGDVCRAGCAVEGTTTVSVQVCEISQFPPGAWWFQVYCQPSAQGSSSCLTPLPAAGLSGTTAVTYSPR